MDSEFFFDTHAGGEGDADRPGDSHEAVAGRSGGPLLDTQHGLPHQNGDGSFDLAHLNMDMDMDMNMMNMGMNMNMGMTPHMDSNANINTNESRHLNLNSNSNSNNQNTHMMSMPLNMNMLDMGMDMEIHSANTPHHTNNIQMMGLNSMDMNSMNNMDVNENLGNFSMNMRTGLDDNQSFHSPNSGSAASTSTSAPPTSTTLQHSHSSSNHFAKSGVKSLSISDFGEGVKMENLDSVSSYPSSASTLTNKKSSPRRQSEKRRSSVHSDDALAAAAASSAAAIASANQQKRTRASGEILDYLVAEFSKNSNPTTQMRKEISSRTGMPERSVRIWFQNRRAKARKLEKLNQSTGTVNNFANGNMNATTSIGNDDQTDSFAQNSNPSTPHSFSQASTTSLFQQSDMKNALNRMNTAPMEINGKYYLIECKSLSVGNWQRIKSGYLKSDTLKSLTNLSPKLLGDIMHTTDLLVILSKKDQELNYFFSGVFQNEKVLFRIFYPIVNILKCSILNQTQQMNNTTTPTQTPNTSQNQNQNPSETFLQLELNASPQFAVHFSRDPTTGQENVNQWSICEDFSEGQQVAAAFIGEGGTGIPHILSDDLNKLKYLSALISSLNKANSRGTPFSKMISQNSISNSSTSSTFPAPNAIHISPNAQYSPLNNPPATNNSTPGSNNMIASGFHSFQDANQYNQHMANEDFLVSEIMYNLNSGDGIASPQMKQIQGSHQHNASGNSPHVPGQGHNRHHISATSPTQFQHMQQQRLKQQQISQQNQHSIHDEPGISSGRDIQEQSLTGTPNSMQHSFAIDGVFTATEFENEEHGKDHNNVYNNGHGDSEIGETSDNKTGSTGLDIFKESENNNNNNNNNALSPLNMNINMNMAMNMNLTSLNLNIMDFNEVDETTNSPSIGTKVKDTHQSDGRTNIAVKREEDGDLSEMVQTPYGSDINHIPQEEA